MIRVLIADDQPLIRAGLRGILDLEDDLSVVGEAVSGRDAVRLARAHTPDVVLMDIRMPDLDGIEATAEICRDPLLSGVHVLVLTTFETDEHVVAALRAGASGFLGKGAEPEAIIDAVHVVARGDALLSPLATRTLIERFLGERVAVPTDATAGPAELGSPGALGAGVEGLTEREREVLMLVGEGLSNDEIAVGLFISPHTVKTHVNRAMMKLDAHDRAQLVVIAYESGLLPRR
ncbi:response regulator transcription factor [Pengzhenrongella sicca]|uniref:Response regulator transcription factor n=1 Tax=Pengzhenrongella sicca TaxID=2819238 RepID=A0A8A4ZF27_9MICO|nr:response regulator transcription factor [Pengzhenrongella sicca]QTE28298.1 response regulator transcription factor [Pengzhenrongella sicca]